MLRLILTLPLGNFVILSAHNSTSDSWCFRCLELKSFAMEGGNFQICESNVGIHFKNPGQAIKSLPCYFKNKQSNNSILKIGEARNIFEHPHILMLKGFALYMNAASESKVKVGNGTICCLTIYKKHSLKYYSRSAS